MSAVVGVMGDERVEEVEEVEEVGAWVTVAKSLHLPSNRNSTHKKFKGLQIDNFDHLPSGLSLTGWSRQLIQRAPAAPCRPAAGCRQPVADIRSQAAVTGSRLQTAR